MTHSLLLFFLFPSISWLSREFRVMSSSYSSSSSSSSVGYFSSRTSIPYKNTVIHSFSACVQSWNDYLWCRTVRWWSAWKSTLGKNEEHSLFFFCMTHISSSAMHSLIDQGGSDTFRQHSKRKFSLLTWTHDMMWGWERTHTIIVFRFQRTDQVLHQSRR